MRPDATDLIETNSQVLRCYLLPGNHPERSGSSIHNKAFEFWKTVWTDTYAELGWRHGLESESFLGHDEVLALFWGNDPVGLVLFKWFDLDLTSHREHSHWSSISPEVFSKIRQECGNSLMTAGFLCVHPEWRRSLARSLSGGSPLPVSGLLGGLTRRRFLESEAMALVALARNHKGAQNLCYSHGGRALLRDMELFNTTADLIAFDRQTIKDGTPMHVREEIERLWRSRQKFARVMNH